MFSLLNQIFFFIVNVHYSVQHLNLKFSVYWWWPYLISNIYLVSLSHCDKNRTEPTPTLKLGERKTDIKTSYFIFKYNVILSNNRFENIPS